MKFVTLLILALICHAAGLYGQAIRNGEIRKVAYYSDCSTDMECYQATGVNY